MDQISNVRRAVEAGGWEYAQAAKEAAKYGGMQNFLNEIFEDGISHGVKTGRCQMVPAMAMTFILGMIFQLVKEPLKEAIVKKWAELNSEKETPVLGGVANPLATVE